MRYTTRPQRKKQLAAKLVMKRVGTRKKRAMPTAKPVYMKAVMRAKRTHVEREMKRVEMAKVRKRSSGTPRRPD
jgi:hypothetical protein